MVWLDLALKTAALASAIIASLRAGSRASYLLTHEGIGVIDGPTIKRSNETYELYELSEAFRHCVRLSIAPQLYDKVQARVPVAKVVEPYPFSQIPYRPQQSSQDESQDKEGRPSTPVDSATVENTYARPSFLKRQWNYMTGALELVPASLRATQQYVRLTPRMVTYWSKRLWSWRNRIYRRTITAEHDSTTLDWDWGQSTKGELKFNITLEDPHDQGASVTKTRVAELSVFCPEAFHDLRNSIFGVSEGSFLQSIFGSGPFVSFQSNSKGAARVGGVFFFTKDGAYMIKTIKNEEAKTLLEMLPKYHKHMRKYGKSSLLTRFCGMYGVRVYDEGSLDQGRLHTFVVMNSVFPPEASNFVSERFDLKGSTVGREVSKEELEKKGSNAVMKDLDLAREVTLARQQLETIQATRKRSNRFMALDDVPSVGLSIGEYAKMAVMAQLREDVKLLVDCQVMDYSLLVGVVHMEGSGNLQSARSALKSLTILGSRYANSDKVEERALWALGAPLRLLLAPPIYIASRAWTTAKQTFASVVTHPLPYYGSEHCVVDGGLLSLLYGTRKGRKAMYYIGLIDFLQPWTTRKVMERKMKGLVGYNTSAISCVSPEEYAERFLAYMDEHLI